MRRNIVRASILYLSIIFFLIFYISERIQASPPAPAPRCRIEGIIQAVTYKEVWTDSNTKGPTDRPTSLPERYELNIFIGKTTYVDGDESYQSCNSLYPVGSTKDMVIGKDKIIGNVIPVKGKNITGIVESFWWPSFDSYTLSSVKERNNPINVFERVKLFFYSIKQFLRI